MASFLVCLGRFAFFILMGIQSFSLASYPATYEDKDGFYALVLFYLLPLGLWLFIMCKDDNLQWLFVVWLLYTIVFVIFIGVIFGGDEPLENKLKNFKEEFLGPNVLKMTLCLSPVLLLLLLSTGTDSMSYIELTGMLSLRIALDLFDGVEMLEVILDENELSHDIPRKFEKGIHGMIALACLSLLLSPWQMAENNLKKEKPKKRTAVLRNIFEIVIDLVFLIVRLVIVFKYKKDESIFIAKNAYQELCLRFCSASDDQASKRTRKLYNLSRSSQNQGMASCLVRFGRFAFFVLLGLQAYSLASYPAKYKENYGYYGLTAVFLPAFVLRLCIMISNKHLQWLFVVWLLYVIGFVILIGFIFGGTAPVEDRFKWTTKSSGDFFGPNVLKMTLCLTPILLLLLLSTGVDSIRYRELMWMLSLRIALDLFDGIEMLEVILDENELSRDVPRSYENAIIAFVCLAFLFSPMQLIEVELGDMRPGGWELDKCTTTLRIALQILCVNGVLLGLRLGLFFGYGKDASIFISKNCIVITLSLFEICSLYERCGCEDESPFW
ncbi:unnamed protein product [Porites evermanni]|uniref:Transmembrane protein n=1 Tax=Porites evermanni TaxID=104178 RepID=A0ABN8LRV0_9CNID|nr:unnamed protein product [Porites evermanni]